MPQSDEIVPIQQAELPLFAGLDVGGTNVKIGVVDDRGRPVVFTNIPTNQDDGPERAAERMGAALFELISSANFESAAVVRAGLATPGPMDLAAGKLLAPGNLPAWRHAPIRDLVSAACGLPVTFANDANAAAYGEYWSGAGSDARNMVLVTLGTGIGGGIIIDGRLLVGAHGAGGECGHIVIDPDDDAPNNSLDVRGTLEGYIGSYGVVARMEQLLDESDGESPLRDVRSKGELTPLAISEAAAAGDAIALQVVMDTARYLAIGLVSIIHTVDPESVVLGGAMTFGGAGHALGDRFLDEVRKQTNLRLFESLRGVVTIDFARLGGDAGFIGAAGLAREEYLAASGSGA